MRKILLAAICCALTIYSFSQCHTNVDFNTWVQGGRPGNGNWIIENGGSQVHQTINGAPTFYLTPFSLMNVHVTGEFKTTDGDDDYMGFVFSFLNPLGATDSFDCWLFDWKQQSQDDQPYGLAPQGMSLDRCNGILDPSTYDPQFWVHQNSPAFTVMANTFYGNGWQRNHWHNFDLYLTYTHAIVKVDGVLFADITDCFKTGRFGFYNLSQADCYYRNFVYDLFVDFTIANGARACRGQAADMVFLNACGTPDLSTYASVKWDYGDGSVQTINNPTAANVNGSHVYNTAGTYTVTITVTDVNGCSSTASHPVTISSPISLTATLTPPLCNGGGDGSIVAQASGGFGPYSYSWNGGANVNANWGGITAGTYVVTVTDGVCVSSAQYVLNQPTALTATTSHTDATCGNNDGSVTISISGGTPPYTGVSWAGVPGYTRTGLAPNFYIADFHDANGCSAALQYRETVSQLPCGIQSNVTTVDVKCYGVDNGSATLHVTGGTGTQTVTWSTLPQQTGMTASNLPPGTYTYNYTDNNAAHAFSGTVTIHGPTAAMDLQLTTTAISCPGSNDGQALASVVSGGYTPYIYVWSSGNPNNPQATGLGPGPVTVTVTDSLGCSASATGFISSVPSLQATLTTVTDSCFHAGRGKVNLSVAGGNPPYTYLWNNASTDTSIPHAFAGAYSVTVTDSRGCSTTNTATVSGPATAVGFTYNKTDVNCYGGATGSFSITTTGGTTPYTYTWNPNSASGNNPTGLVAGVYSYTITDAYGCSVQNFDTIKQPTAALNAVVVPIDVKCPGGMDGALVVTLSGGTEPYSFQGSSYTAGTDTIPGLPAGTYGGTVADANGCTTTAVATINEPQNQRLQLDSVDATCNGGLNGSITATYVNGTGAVTFNWNPGGNLASPRTGLGAGAYAVTATDANGCTVANSTIINEPAAPNMPVTAVDATCFGGNGTATANPAGQAPITYTWSAYSSNNATINPPQGSYTVTAVDANHCNETGSFTINQPTAITVQVQKTDVLCFGNSTGSITLTPAGGNGPNYTFTWNPNVSNSNTASGLAANNYDIAIKDQNNCVLDTVITVAQPQAALTATPVPVNISCNGLTDGSITINTTGGTANYTYQWSPNVSNNNQATGLGAQTYNVTVTDANSCTTSATADIIEPAAITFTQAKTDLDCYNVNTGSASVVVSGGTPTYNYTWNPNVSSSDVASGIGAGVYDLTMTDSRGCSVTTTFTLTQPPAYTLTLTKQDNQCYGYTNGFVAAAVSGGTPGYTYAWTPNVSTSDSALNLLAGAYSVTVTDTKGCTLTDSRTITSPSQIALTVDTVAVRCFGDANGQIQVTAQGGSNPYTFATVSNGTNVQNATGLFTGLVTGTYTITITDNNTCSTTTSATVNTPGEISNLVDSFDVSCHGYTDGKIIITTSGGVTPFTYTLSNGAQNGIGTFLNVPVGSYDITIADANACTTTASATIGQPDSLTVDIVPDSVEVKLGNSIELQTVTNQTTGAITYQWQPGFGLSCYDCPNPLFSGNVSQVYTITLTNNTGCKARNKVTIIVVPDYTIFIPNVFSPGSSNNANSTWGVMGNLNNIKQFNLVVFNRIGEKVFESDNPNTAWDGTYKGKDAPMGVYTYVIQIVWLDNKVDTNKKGSVTLMR